MNRARSFPVRRSPTVNRRPSGTVIGITRKADKMEMLTFE
jgi:hypothetical protein